MHSLSKRLAVLAIFGAVCIQAAAAAWPDRPIRMIVSFPAGSSTDVPGRIVAAPLSTRLGQPLVVENIAGAAGGIGARTIARSAPDGYTIGLASSSAFSIAPSLQAKLAYDPLTDFTPLGLIGRTPYVIVASPTLGIKTWRELVALAKAKPDGLNYGSAGPGSVTHLATLLLASETKTRFNHIPYKTSASANTDLIAGRIHFQMAGVAAALPLIAAGTIPLAVTGRARLAALPDVPTIAETGVPNFDVSFWLGIVGPAGMPRDIVERINGDMKAVLAMDKVQSALAAQGLDAEWISPDAFARLIATEITQWREVTSNAGLKPE
jgi:tripartite-type tricarboxylate transporter receptor subunit TctC